MEASIEGGQAVSDFKGRHFGGEIVLWAVRWYCRYGISYRDLEQMMAERGVSVDHSTIYRWVQRYAPEIEKRLRWHWRRPRSRSWRVDETYVKVRGKWSYLYRAVDKLGNTIDFYLSPTRNTMAAKHFLAKALRGLKDWEQPEVTYAAALAELKAEGKCPRDTQHRQVKYLNNIVEADHGKLKQLIRPVRGFKSRLPALASSPGSPIGTFAMKPTPSPCGASSIISSESRWRRYLAAALPHRRTGSSSGPVVSAAMPAASTPIMAMIREASSTRTSPIAWRRSTPR
jgi:transposase, IS6 family